MHPVISQAVAAERSRERRASAAAGRRAASFRAGPGGRLLSLIGVSGAEHGRGVRQALRPLRDPRTA